MKIYIENVEKTLELGILLGSLLKPKDVICLNGDLGAGKTHFSKGIAKGMLIEEDITSPTFTIVQEYEGMIPLLHFDVYRIADSEEMYYIGYEDYLKRDAVSIIEWSKLIQDILPLGRLEVDINYALEGGRYFEFTPYGKRHEALLEELFIKFEKKL